MLTPKTKPIQDMYVGGVEVAENGHNLIIWILCTRHEKCNAYIDAIKLMRELEGER